MADKKDGARSYRGSVIGDSMNLTINMKWLLQLFVFAGMLVYGWWQLESRIQDLERNMVVALEEIELHEQERQIAEEQHIQALELQMQEQTVWIEQELGINLNPFSWGKKKGR
tara:strand:- start:1305 stop:1643 length:339 start_codon:yes stop_codon:yes gene_type:complete